MGMLATSKAPPGQLHDIHDSHHGMEDSRYFLQSLRWVLQRSVKEQQCLDLLTCMFAARPNHIELKLVRVRLFFSLRDGGPKSWWQGRTLPTNVVDMHSFGLLKLFDFIAEHCLWGSKRYITLWRDLENYSMEINLMKIC